MTATATELLRSSPPPRGIAWPLLLWLAVQMGVLLVAGAQIPLSEKFTRPAERLAMEEMLVVQIAFSALLFPIILDGVWASLAAIATVWPMLALAGVLSVRPAGEVVRSATYVSLWMGLLGVWNWILPSQRSRLIGCTVAGGLSIGGGLLAYLRVEFDTTAATTWADLGFFGPILDVLRALDDGRNWGFWSGLLYLIVFTAVVSGMRVLIGRLRKRVER